VVGPAEHEHAAIRRVVAHVVRAATLASAPAAAATSIGLGRRARGAAALAILDLRRLRRPASIAAATATATTAVLVKRSIAAERFQILRREGPLVPLALDAEVHRLRVLRE